MTNIPRKFAYLIDPLRSLQPAKDSTLALIRESQRRGHLNFTITLEDLYLENDVPLAVADRIVFGEDELWRVEERRPIRLTEMDVVLMRKDPPVDVRYVMATYILDRVDPEQTLVLNNPRALRDLNEKVIVSRFPDIAPATLVTASAKRIRKFLVDHPRAVIKPTNLMGGRSIYLLAENDPNHPVIIEDMTERGRRYVIVQEYLPAIRESGDQRILLIDGRPVSSGIARMPARGDHRGNLATGAQAQAFSLTERQRSLGDRLGGFLRDNGLFFVGIDVIGDKVTEINITSPTGIVEIKKATGIDAAAMFFDSLSTTYGI